MDENQWDGVHTDQLKQQLQTARIEHERIRHAHNRLWVIFVPVLSAMLLGSGYWVWTASTTYARAQLLDGTAKDEDVIVLKNEVAGVKTETTNLKNEVVKQTLRIDAVIDQTSGMYRYLIEDQPKASVDRDVKAAQRKRGTR